MDNLKLCDLELRYHRDGLIPVITQDARTLMVLMQAWMNPQALEETITTGRVCYWSRSRQKLWRKGETSGHWQQLIAAFVDCDHDCLLLHVKQHGPACHTGHAQCFYRQIALTAPTT